MWDRTSFTANTLITLGVLTTVSTLGPSILYLFGQLSLRRDWLRRFSSLPVLLIVGMGVAVSNTRAVLEGLVGIRSAFVRTPKDSLTGAPGATKSKAGARRRYRLPLDPVFLVEAFMAVWCAWAFYDHICCGHVAFAPYLVIFALGFATMAIATASDAISGWFSGRDDDDAEHEIDLRELSANAVADAMAAWNPADSMLIAAAMAEPLPVGVVDSPPEPAPAITTASGERRTPAMSSGRPD